MTDSISKALGSGEEFTLRNGETILVFPASLVTLEESMKLFDRYAGTSIQGLYLPDNEDRKVAFEDLMLLAYGQDEIRADEEKRPAVLRELLSKFYIDDGGDEVRNYIARFLGFVPRDPGAETAVE